MKLFLALALTTATIIAADAPLKLPGADGHEHTPLVVPEGKKAAVLIFVSPYCPTANKFMPEVNRIAAAYAPAFTFHLVHADADVKLADVLQHNEMNQVIIPVLLDRAQLLAKRTGATITPEAVVLGADGTTLYQGRINDLYLGPTKKQRQATTRDLCDALEAIQQGKPVTTPKTEAMGCKILLK